MDKLQWFKFTPSDWMMGKIQRCPEITQARFLRLCCLYWNKDCEISIEDAIIEVEQDQFDILKNRKIIAVDENNIFISFLDEQYLEIKESSKERSVSGIIGNLKRWHPFIYNSFASKEISLEKAVELSKVIAEPSLPDSEPIAIQSQSIADKDLDKTKTRQEKESNITLYENKFSTEVVYLSELLFNKILENNPNAKKPKLEKWQDEIDKINRLDNYTFEQIKYVILWTQKDSFWKSNILSASKLRDKMDSLIIKIKEEKEKEKGSAQKEKPKYVVGRQTQESLENSYKALMQPLPKYDENE